MDRTPQHPQLGLNAKSKHNPRINNPIWINILNSEKLKYYPKINIFRQSRSYFVEYKGPRPTKSQGNPSIPDESQDSPSFVRAPILRQSGAPDPLYINFTCNQKVCSNLSVLSPTGAKWWVESGIFKADPNARSRAFHSQSLHQMSPECCTSATCWATPKWM